ncbi:MAG: YfhO family protein [Anaerolineae bacterium]|nr:YfhO family protein [Anaerolineae bacterium]
MAVRQTAAGQVRAFRLPDTPGRAWVVPHGRFVPRDEMLMLLAAPDFDPTAEVLLEQPTGIPQVTPASRAQRSPIRLRDGHNRVTIHVTLETPGYLVLADTWYPGWQATVDGEPAPLMRANYAFRAVWLEAGEHTVEMAYRPRSVLVGGMLSVVVLVVMVGVRVQVDKGTSRQGYK